VLVFKIEIIEILDKEGLPLAIKCNAIEGDQCDEEDKAYLETIGKWTDEKKTSELERLGNSQRRKRA